LPEKYVLKSAKCPNFTRFLPENYQNTRIFMIFARTFYKIPEFHMIFARKMPEFYVIIAQKYFIPNFRGARAPVPPSPTPMSEDHSYTLTQLHKTVI